ncbi:ribosome-binding factor A [Algibacter lectus]|uniref:Ribosome-binding factor A n=1 Tax=Algibacter lectus TaxID=221126 RepID=A0A090WT52_9FLAO|nr:ribosome-binding factor A [Algibacter lectus]
MEEAESQRQKKIGGGVLQQDLVEVLQGAATQAECAVF